MQDKYQKQYAEIRNLLKRIDLKCCNFARQETNPNYGDLGWVLDELKDIDQFINDSYLKSKNHAKLTRPTT